MNIRKTYKDRISEFNRDGSLYLKTGLFMYHYETWDLNQSYFSNTVHSVLSDCIEIYGLIISEIKD